MSTGEWLFFGGVGALVIALLVNAVIQLRREIKEQRDFEREHDEKHWD